MARPQKGLQEYRVRTDGIAIQMCIDRSGSMLAEDFQLDSRRANRLTAVKSVFRKFVQGEGNLPGRVNDAVGLIAFGGFAESRVPLTLDHDLLVSVLDDINVAQPIRDAEGNVINMELLQEERATAIGDALALAVERLKGAAQKSKIVILLSDGENTAGEVEPQMAADLARSFGIKIYTIGVGRSGFAPYPVGTRSGRVIYRRQHVELDEATLTELAEKTDGKYFNASSTVALRDVYEQIDRLEKTKTEGRLYTQYQEWFPLFVIPGGALIVLHLVLVSTWFQSLPD